MRKYPVKATGGVRARFLLDTEVIAGQDIEIEKEITQCKVQTDGVICMPSGRIVGGEAHAGMGIEIGQAGTDAAVPTLLHVGLTGEAAKEVCEKEDRIAALEQNSERIRRTIEPLRARMASLPVEKREIVTQLMTKQTEIDDAVSVLQEEVEELRRGGRMAVVIRGMLFPETTITIGRSTKRVRESRQGPLRVVESRGRLRFQGLGRRR